jgi:hypothetical protein
LRDIFLFKNLSDLSDSDIDSNMNLIFIGNILIEEDERLNKRVDIFDMDNGLNNGLNNGLDYGFGGGLGDGFGFDIVDDIIDDIEEDYPVIFYKDGLDIRYPGMIIIWIEDWELLIRIDIGYYISLIWINIE